MIAFAATLVGCSRQPTHQAGTRPCADERQFACLPITAPRQPIEYASVKTDAPTETRLKREKPPTLRGRDRASRFTTKARPASTRAKTEPTATHIPLPPPSLSTQPEPKSKAAADLGTTVQSTVVLSPDSKRRTLREQVAAATEVAERMTVAASPAAHDNVEPAELLVAVVMARPEIKSVADLARKNVAMDERYSTLSVDVWIGFVVAGRVSVEVSTGQTAAIDRLSNGEVAAAVVALVSADAADGFPEIAGFKIFRVPLWPPALKARPNQ